MKGFLKMIYDLQKADFWKRVSAFILDIILMLIAVTGFATLVSTIVNIEADNNSYIALMDSYNKKYSDNQWGCEINFLEEKFGEIAPEDLTEEQKKFIADASAEITADPEYQRISNMIFNKTVIIVTFSLLLSFIILEFIVPMILKNGQTVGKKIFSIAVIRIDGVRVSPVIIFVRSILGKFTIETMIPAYLLLMHHFYVGTYVTLAVLILIPIFQIILLIKTKTNSCIHDILSSTVVVDLQSQMIFDSPEAKQEYQLRLHNEEANNAKYF